MLPQVIQDDVREIIGLEQHKYKEYHGRTKLKGVKYAEGEIIYVKRAADARGESTKLQIKTRGPLVVTKVLAGDTYRVADVNKAKSGRRYAATAHVSQMKPCRPNHNEDEPQPEYSDQEDDIDTGSKVNPDKPGIEQREATKIDDQSAIRMKDEEGQEQPNPRRISTRNRRQPQRLTYPER